MPCKDILWLLLPRSTSAAKGISLLQETSASFNGLVAAGSGATVTSGSLLLLPISTLLAKGTSLL